MPISQARAGSAPQEITGKAGNKGGHGSQHDAFNGLLEAVAAASAGQATLAPDGRPAGNRNGQSARAPKADTGSPSVQASPPRLPALALQAVRPGHDAQVAGQGEAAASKSPAAGTASKAAAPKPAPTGKFLALGAGGPVEPPGTTPRPRASAAPALSTNSGSGKASRGTQAPPAAAPMPAAVQAPGLQAVKSSGAMGQTSAVRHAPRGGPPTGHSPATAPTAPVTVTRQEQPQGASGPAAIVIPPSALQVIAAPAAHQATPSAIPAQARAAIGSQVASTVSGHLSTEATGARTTLRLSVFPENLGEVVVRITTWGGALSVHLSGSSAALGQMLHASRSDIAASLESAGASNVTVELGLFGGDTQRQGGRRQPETPNPALFHPGWQASAVRRTQAPEGPGGPHRLDLLA